MKTRRIVAGLMMLLIPFAGFAQGKKKTTHKKVHHTAAKVDAQQPSLIYFPEDGQYDAARGGYVFYKDGKETFTPTVQPYMNPAPDKTEIPLFRGLSLDLQPQLHYPNYMTVYPAVHEYNDVPVPTNR